MTKHSCTRAPGNGGCRLPPRVPRQVPQWSSAKRKYSSPCATVGTENSRIFVVDTLMAGQSTRLGSERKQAPESKTNSDQKKFPRRAPRGARPDHALTSSPSSSLSKTHAPQMYPCVADVTRGDAENWSPGRAFRVCIVLHRCRHNKAP